jgi:hypothetical protein
MKFDKMHRNEIRDLLAENVLRVTFDKKNGERRIMTCTLRKDILPPTDTKRVYKESQQSISVWDTNAAGWRAFCVENVKDIEKVS